MTLEEHFSLFYGAENADSDIRRVRDQFDMFGISFPRAIISAALVLLSILAISGRYPSGTKYQQNPEEAMASSLRTLIVPPKGKHAATVIFMHVRRYRFQSASPSNAKSCTGVG